MVDRPALEHPVGLAKGRPALAASRSPMSSSPSSSYLPPQPLKRKPAPARRPLPRRSVRVAQPDVPERLNDDVGERRELSRGVRRPLVRRDQPHRLSGAAGMDRLGEHRDLALRRLEVAEPQLRDRSGIRSTRLRGAPIRGAEGRVRRHRSAANRRIRRRQAGVSKVKKDRRSTG